MLSFLVFFPFFSAFLIWCTTSQCSKSARFASILVLFIECIVLCSLYFLYSTPTLLYSEYFSWIPHLGLSYYLFIDYFSFVMICIVLSLSLIAIVIGWNSIDRWFFFGPLLLCTTAGLIGVFLAYDLILFYVFWEIMLIPMYFMMRFWGHNDSAKNASLLFLLSTIVASFIMLVGMITLSMTKATYHGLSLNFAFDALINTPAPIPLWITLTFLIGLGIKIPAFPLHFWAPAAYKTSHPAVTIVLSGAMSNAGIYGLLRFFSFLPSEHLTFFSEIGMALASIGALYTGFLAYQSQHLRTTIAYSSISHMNLALLAVFSLQREAINGAFMQLVAHALSIAGLFSIMVVLKEQGVHGHFSNMGGFFKKTPKLGAFLLFFIIASVGMPGLSNFAAEILIFIGSFPASITWTIVASFSIVIGIIYFLYAYEKSMLGPYKGSDHVQDLCWRQFSTMGLLAFFIFLFGLFPSIILKPFDAISHHVSYMQSKGVTSHAFK